MSKLDWEKDRRTHPYTPSPLAQPPSQRQLDYILGLSHRKACVVSPLPKTKRGAGQVIERLHALPEVNEPVWFRNGKISGSRIEHVEASSSSSDRNELLLELRQCFPQLSPMSVNSLIQLFGQVDELGMLFTFDALMREDVPEDSVDLILHILRRLLAEIAPVTRDDTALAER